MRRFKGYLVEDKAVEFGGDLDRYFKVHIVVLMNILEIFWLKLSRPHLHSIRRLLCLSKLTQETDQIGARQYIS